MPNILEAVHLWMEPQQLGICVKNVNVPDEAVHKKNDYVLNGDEQMQKQNQAPEET